MPNPNQEAMEAVETAFERGVEVYDWAGVRIRFRGSFMAGLAVEAARPAIEKEVRERRWNDLIAILGCCQEVAHEVEDPIQACAEIEGIARKALAALDKEGEDRG